MAEPSDRPNKLATRGTPCPNCGVKRTVLLVEQGRDGRGRLRLRCLVCRFTESRLYRVTSIRLRLTGGEDR